MPGPGHEHSERFERCLAHTKPKAPKGRDPDEFAHRVCYTSVGKQASDCEGCGEGHVPGHDREILPGVFTLDDLALGCMYCKSLIEEEGYRNKMYGQEHQGASAYDTKDAGPASSATPGAVNPVYERKMEAMELRLSDLEHCAERMKTLTAQFEKSILPGEFHLNMHILNKDDDTRHIAGWASVEIVDRHGELITATAFNDKVFSNFMERTGGRIFLQHQDVPVGKITKIERRKMPDGTPGVWLEADLFHMDSIDEAVWAGVLQGKISGFSIKGRAMDRETRCNADLCYAYIEDIELYAVSAVEKPANQAAAIYSVTGPGHNAGIDKAHNASKVGPLMSKKLRKEDEEEAEDSEEEEEEESDAAPAAGHLKHGEEKEEPEGGQYVEKPQKPDAAVPETLEARFKSIEDSISGLTEAFKKLAPGTQEAARTAAAMAEGMARKDVSKEDEDEEEKEDEDEERKEDAAPTPSATTPVMKGPFDVPHQEPEGGIPGHGAPDFGFKKEKPAGGQYVEHPAEPGPHIPEALVKQLESVTKQLEELKKVPVATSRTAPLALPVGSGAMGGSNVDGSLKSAIEKRLRGQSSEQEFMRDLHFKY